MVSIVMPAYNEGDIIGTTVQEWIDTVIPRLPGSELIVVNDCSRDNTGAVLDELVRRTPGLRVVHAPINGGHGRALRLGFRAVTQEFTFQTDSDRQHVPADFWKLWPEREKYDFLMGVRETRADGGFRLAITRSMRLLNFLVWNVWIRDANCPFKLMRTAALQKVLHKVPENSFIPMVMVSILSRKMGFRARDVVVTHLPRQGGQQSLKGLLRWVRVAVRCAWQLICWRASLLFGGIAKKA